MANDIKKPEPKKHSFFHQHLNFKKDGPFNTYFNILIGYIDSVIFLNLFFILTSILVFSFGPSLCAVVATYNDLANNKDEKRYRAYFKHFKEYLTIPMIIFGVLYLGFLCLAVYSSWFYFLNTQNSLWFYIPFILTLLIFLLLTVFATYLTQLYVRMDVNFKTIFKNALLLTFSKGANALLCVFSFALFFVLPFLLIEYLFLFFIIIGFSVCILSCNMSVYSVVDKFLIKTSDEEEKGEKPIKTDLIDKKYKNTIRNK